MIGLYIFQLSYLMRRVLRARTKRNCSVSDLSPQTQAVFSGMPSDPDSTQLHFALLIWFSKLPKEWKAFESLDDFRISKASPSVPPPSGPHSPWVFNPFACHMHLIFTGIFAVLHDPRAFNGVPMYAVNSNSTTLVSALEICIMALRAHIYVLRCVFSSAGWANPPDLDIYVDTASLPPSPMQISQNPAMGFSPTRYACMSWMRFR
ncbi:hypothetical protein BC829DRAFT_155174 [Chytridium lagenaria]|nr:hypothetical protein BC829DRAFT_155174 [Chytridium lagenaria]